MRGHEKQGVGEWGRGVVESLYKRGGVWREGNLLVKGCRAGNYVGYKGGVRDDERLKMDVWGECGGGWSGEKE